MQEKVIPLAQVNISTDIKLKALDIKVAQPIFILGRNGTGKSALAQNLVSQLTDYKKLVYMPGSRPSYFDNESLLMTPQSRRELDNNRNYYSGVEARWKSLAGTMRNEKAIHDLSAAEAQYAMDIISKIKLDGENSSAIRKLQENNSPLDKVNSLLKKANLTVQITMQDGELKSERCGEIYSYAKMSDGERTALIFAAEIASVKSETIFIIDEPELHLHPSIVISLIRAMLLSRPDCGFIICTHELELPQVVSNSQVVLVRNCTWENDHVKNWDIDLIDNKDEIPEWLWSDVVGSRRIILFVEGDEKNSLDHTLYSILFPEVTIRPCRSCKDVIEAVKGLGAMVNNHRITAFGIIDNDGMSEENVKRFQEKNIYPLPIFSVESLIYSAECLEAVAARQAETLSDNKEKLMNKAINEAIKSLGNKGVKENLAARVAERHLREGIFSSIPSHIDIKNKGTTVDFSCNNPYQDELSKISSLIQNKDLREIIARYPIRESGVPKAIADAMGFNHKDRFEEAVISRVQHCEELHTDLKKKLNSLVLRLSEEQTIDLSVEP